MRATATIVLAVLMLLTSCRAGQAAAPKGRSLTYTTSKALVENTVAGAARTPEMEARVTAIDCRADLTRVALRLTGRPHTSQRIDAATLTPSKGRALEATDIDGVDFRRYFQWEDDGAVDVEIDFPPLRKAAPRYTLTLTTPYATYIYSITAK